MAQLRPNEATLNQINLDPGGIAVTARGAQSERGEGDFVSRFFTPQCNIFEDPVTGSSLCSLAPYWAEKLGKKSLRARQVQVLELSKKIITVRYVFRKIRSENLTLVIINTLSL